jgi:hypothetical protein
MKINLSYKPFHFSKSFLVALLNINNINQVPIGESTIKGATSYATENKSNLPSYAK